MRKTLLLSIILLSSMPGIQKSLIAQEKTSLNQVVNTLKERISLAGYAQLGYTYDDAAKPDNTFDIKRIIFMAHGKITKRWTCDFMYDFYNGGMLLEVYTDYQFLPGLTARIGEFKVPYTIENELSPTTVELINCYSQSVCYLAGVSGSDERCCRESYDLSLGMAIRGRIVYPGNRTRNSRFRIYRNQNGRELCQKALERRRGCYHFPFQSAYRISRRQGPERKK